MRTKLTPSKFAEMVDDDDDEEEEAEEEDDVVEDKTELARTGGSEILEVEDDESLVEECIEGFKLSGCLSPSINNIEEGNEKKEFDVEQIDKRISSGEIRKLMEEFGEDEEGKEEEGDEEESKWQMADEDSEEDDSGSSLGSFNSISEPTTFGAVIAGSTRMLGPWVDMDEDDCMYKVPLDRDGKVKRRRRRNRHR
jgi:hypothetical protein